MSDKLEADHATEVLRARRAWHRAMAERDAFRAPFKRAQELIDRCDEQIKHPYAHCFCGLHDALARQYDS